MCIQLLYPLRIKPSSESEHGGEQVIVEIDQPKEKDTSVEFQAVEDARMIRNVHNGFWVN